MFRHDGSKGMRVFKGLGIAVLAAAVAAAATEDAEASSLPRVVGQVGQLAGGIPPTSRLVRRIRTGPRAAETSTPGADRHSLRACKTELPLSQSVVGRGHPGPEDQFFRGFHAHNVFSRRRDNTQKNPCVHQDAAAFSFPCQGNALYCTDYVSDAGFTR